MITFQEFEERRKQGEARAIQDVIEAWKSGETYQTAVIANTYDRQQNNTIMTFVKKMFTLAGLEIKDFTASNNKIASNFFHRFNTQRNTYLLGNGVEFSKDGIKEKFGEDFDEVLLSCAYSALIHGVCFPFWNGKLVRFDATEFAPLWDEETGALRAGIRFWQIDTEKPMYAEVFERDGMTRWKKDKGDFAVVIKKRAYKATVQQTAADGAEIVGVSNYSELPIIPLWNVGEPQKSQSTLIGLQNQIDSYDMIRSGFANDLSDVAQIFWILENYGGMDNNALAQFLDRLKLNHIAEMDTSDGGKITPYTVQIPFEARQAYLDGLRKEMYDGFGALDVSSISASAKTATEIEAAHQPLDECADAFEIAIIKFVKALAELIGIPKDDATPIFKRNKISNQREQTDMVVSAAAWLDEETVLRKLPFLTVDEVKSVMERKGKEEAENAFKMPKKEEVEVEE